MSANYAIAMTDYAKAALLEVESIDRVEPDEVLVETLYSLISPGTEIAHGFLGQGPFPVWTGYAAVGRVMEAGSAVAHVQPGDIVFTMGNHRLCQALKASTAFKLPEGLEPSIAVITRLMGVSMTTLTTTAARPGDRVLVMGAGPVGYLAAHLFRHAGYKVSVCDPDPERLRLIEASGKFEVYRSLSEAQITDNKASTEADTEDFVDGKPEPFALVAECSGHEAALLAGLRNVRKGGEVVMIGVPWRKQTDHTAHEIAWEVFHRYAVLRSGWEWELPIQSDEFNPHSIYSNLKTAARWLQEGRIPLADTIRIESPTLAQEVYRGLADRMLKELFVVFDWSKI